MGACGVTRGTCAGDEAAPLLAHEGGADEERGIVRGEAEEDLLHQGGRQRRRHPGSLVAARGFAGLNELKNGMPRFGRLLPHAAAQQAQGPDMWVLAGSDTEVTSSAAALLFSV